MTATKAILGTNMRIEAGEALPFGAWQFGQGWNFAIVSKHAFHVTLAFFRPGERIPIFQHELKPPMHRTGDVWHCYIEGLDPAWRYGFYIDGPQSVHFAFDPQLPLLDPYATAVDEQSGLGILDQEEPFDWSQDRYLNIPLEQSVIYEMHVAGFTKDPNSGVQFPGTFSGIIEKIPYLQSLGVTAVELLPVHFFNRTNYQPRNPQTGELLHNYWGYATLNFFSLMPDFSPAGIAANRAFKEMVLALHQAGIEVILDVVFNHTGEGLLTQYGRSFCGIERPSYYMLNEHGQDLNFSGCGNTVNCNHPMVRELVRWSLRHFVCEMHVDGFRFDLASILGRDMRGHPLSNPPLIESIAFDPVMARTKLIAEAWDAGGLYQVGDFAKWGKWSEWNGKYRDDVRAFIKGDRGRAGAFATRLCGSSDLYGRAHPSNSINFITAHDGFSLRDLVSYNGKHNEANGENNQDGCNDNCSWNCGWEGDTTDPAILQLREKQMRNFIVALATSQGACMLKMGDEYGHTQKGNNNAWCQDNALSWFLWKEKENSQEFWKFVQGMLLFRKHHPLLTQRSFLESSHILWHGKKELQPDWSDASHLVAFTLFDEVHQRDLFIAFHADYQPVEIELPSGAWSLIVDTDRAPYLSWEPTVPPAANLSGQYTLAPYSSLILKKKPS